MAVILGLEDHLVEEAVRALNMGNELWCANFNCPGQVVISGTKKGVEAGSKACLEKGAKRALPLQVHGAFHSGLMKSAEEKLAPHLQETHFQKSAIQTVSNVTGDKVEAPDIIRELLLKQITYPVRWQKGIRTLDPETDIFIEIGCGKTLSGLNKRIGTQATTHTLEKVEDLKNLESLLV
jgi:[acyl-carrier-protein] S-malonyltransferase